MTIQLRNVRFAYPDTPSNTILDIPQWSVPQGEKLFVHGPSGCGKSTLLGLLSGMLAAQQGEIEVLDQRLDQLKASKRDRFRANAIGYVFQQFNLIPYLNATENIQLAHFFSRSDQTTNTDIDGTEGIDSAALLTELGIQREDQQKPASMLSIGQQQRVAIARAMINRPQLLIADEPTSSLDEQNRDNFMALLMALVEKYNITLLFVSHDLSLAHYFDRVEALAEINRATLHAQRD